MDGKAKISAKFHQSLQQVHADIEKVDILASALTAFLAPVPGYDVPAHQIPRGWIGTDYPHSGPLERVLGFER